MIEAEPATGHAKLLAWVEEVAALTQALKRIAVDLLDHIAGLDAGF